MSMPSIPAATITSVSKSKTIITNDNDRIINSVISHQQNGQLISAPNSRRDENHHFMTGSNKQSSIINLNSNALNQQSTSNTNGQNNIDENLFRAQNALINKAPILTLDNSTIVGNAFANNITLVRNSVISSSRGYINTSVNNERDNNLHNQFDTIRDDYLYRNKKIRFGELMEKDRVFKH